MPSTGYVYLLGSSRFGWYKIGKSRTPNLRVAQIGILLPFKIEVFAIWQTLNGTLLESMMHTKYSAHAINGEWFSFFEAEVVNAIDDQQPFDARRIYPHSGDSDSRHSFSNICIDVTKPPCNPFKERKRLAFNRAIDRYIKERNLDRTPDNLRAAKSHAHHLFKLHKLDI